MGKQSTSSKPIRLNFHERGRQVVVTPENEDRFMMTVQEAASILQQANQQVLFVGQFQLLLNALAAWLSKHRAKVFRSFLTVREGRLLFLVVRKQVRYDDPFDDSLTELDMQTAQDDRFSLIELEVLALPNASPGSFNSFLDEPVWEYVGFGD